ncbi:hypothetical protein ACPYIV_12855 [Parabacteroides sp. ASD2025]|uniref:hypothetical protein n=1 Tax=Parabacteroides sp. ASD2025 TaxID=3415987 RepID=UPI003CED82B5
MFVTAYNYSNVPSEVVQEKVSNDLLVEPSESFTVRELVYRLAMGMPVSSGLRSGEYPDRDQDFDDVLPTDNPDFDFADYATLSREISERENARNEAKEKAYREKLAKEKATVDENNETVSTS